MQVLLERGAPVDVQDETFKTPPLHWALYGWSNGDGTTGAYYRIVSTLVQRGARAAEFWQRHEKVASDATMREALRGADPADPGRDGPRI